MFNRLLVREWERKGKESCLVLGVGKHVTERDSKLIILVEERNDFRHDSSPFLLLGWHDSIYRFQTLIVQFALNG